MEVVLEQSENVSQITIVEFTRSDAGELEYRTEALTEIHNSGKYDSTVYVRVHIDEDEPGLTDFYKHVGELDTTPVFISIVNDTLLNRFDGHPSFEDFIALAE